MKIQRRKSPPPMPKSANSVLSVCFLSLTLIGCSGGGSDEPAQNPSDSDDPTINPALVTASTEELQRTAARRVANGMGINLESLQRLSDDAMRDLEPGSIGAELVADVDLEMLAVLDSNNSKFMHNTLGLDDSNALVMREGNFITIDPDEQLICADEFPLLDLTDDDLPNCEQLLQDLSVQIHAHSDESGLITYSFQSNDVLVIGYSENSASYELQLTGLQQLVERTQQLSGNTVSEQVAMSGALRLSATVLNDVEGAVAGELVLEVTQALSLVSSQSASESINLQPSTVFKININEATGDVITSVNWGSLQLLADISENGDGSMLSQLTLGGLSANATLNANTSILKLTDVGIGNVPLTININQINTVSLTLSTFDVTLDAESGMVTFDGALGAALTVSNILGVIEELGPEASASLSINAAAGTTLQDEGNGSTKVLNNGPFAISAGVVSDGVSLQQSVSFNAGECFASNGEADAGLGLDLTAVPCAQ
jgi:hypothetical protein